MVCTARHSSEHHDYSWADHPLWTPRTPECRPHQTCSTRSNRTRWALAEGRRPCIARTAANLPRSSPAASPHPPGDRTHIRGRWAVGRRTGGSRRTCRCRNQRPDRNSSPWCTRFGPGPGAHRRANPRRRGRGPSNRDPSNQPGRHHRCRRNRRTRRVAGDLHTASGCTPPRQALRLCRPCWSSAHPSYRPCQWSAARTALPVRRHHNPGLRAR